MKRSFQARVFVNVLSLVLTICFSLAFFFARLQTHLLESEIEADGIKTSKILASNLRLGLLTGGEEFLAEPVTGMMEQRDVMQVAVYGKKGGLVMLKEKKRLQNLQPAKNVIAQLRRYGKPVVLSGPHHFEFWVPVSYARSLNKYNNGFFPKPSVDKDIIGFAKLSLSKKKIINGRKYILTWTAVIIVFCIFLGSAVSYYIATRVTNPLKSLVGEIRNMGGSGIRKLSTSGDNEIRELSDAFNAMADSLEKRETARREAERVLHASEERLKTVIDNAPIILYAIDAAGVFTLVEGRGLGNSLKPGGIVGQSAFERCTSVSAEDGGKIIPDCDALKHVLSGETVNFVSTVSEGFFDNRLVPFRDAAGKIIGAIGVAIDITERKRAEEKLQLYQKELRSLASQLSLTEERERRVIATDLHDNIGQLLAISKIKLGKLKELSDDGEAVRQTDEIRGLIEQAIDYTRSLTFELSSPILYELGLEPAVEWLAEQFRAKYDLSVVFESDGLTVPLDTERSVLIFKAVRELLLNTVKHARAQQAIITVSGSGEVMKVTVEDDGAGFVYAPPEAANDGAIKSFGLFSVRESLRHAGGRLDIKSAPGHGTKVTLEVPVRAGGAERTMP